MKHWLWRVGIGLTLLCGLVITWRVAPTFSSSALLPLDQAGIGYDPLTPPEAERALALALQSAAPAREAGAAAGVPLEVLAVERYDAPKESGGKRATDTETWRRGDVFLYDYTTDTLIRTIVDLASGATQRIEAQGVQLPLTVGEKARALQLVREDSALWTALADRYWRVTGEALESTAQIEVKISLFFGESMPDQVNDAARQCGQHRCAQLLLFTVDRTLLEVMPIVDLSTGRVVQLLSDSWIAPQPAETSAGSEKQP